MRELLTGLAIILIVALTAALVAPYFIDWNGQRAFIEARLSQVLGQKVTIGGTIDVKLLPTPYLVLGQTVIGSDDGPTRLGIHHLELELSIAPLLHGEFDVTQARLVEPTIRITLMPDRTLPALSDAPAFHADISLDHIDVTDGTLAVADPMSGRTFVLDNLDFEADATSLAGPFKGAGTEGPDDARTSFRFATAAARDGRAHARLIVAENAAHAGFDLDGTVALTSAGRTTVRQSFAGRVTISGRLDESAGAPVAWTLDGPLKADPAKAQLDGGELRLGGEDNGLVLAASGTADLGADPRLDLDLSAKTLDLDRLAGATPTGAPLPPPQLPPLATVRRALAAATPPLPTRVDVKIDTATWAGETLSDLSAQIGVGGTGPQPFKLAAAGPGGAHLDVDGTLTPGRFAGRVALAAEDVPQTANWIAAVAPALSFQPGELPVRSASLSANVAMTAEAIAASKVDLQLGASRLEGTARIELADAEHRAKLTADLGSKMLSLDTLPDVTTLRRPARALDLDLHLDTRTLKVAEAGEGTLVTGPLRLSVTKTGAHLALTSFSADNLDGATISASGSLDPDTAHLGLQIDAAHLDAAARLVRQVAPGALADALVARAPALAPAKMTLNVTWRTTDKGKLEPSLAKIDGTFGGTVLHADLNPDADGVFALDTTLDAPDGTALLRQLGFAALPIDTLGRSTMSLEARGTARDGFESKLDAHLGATNLGLAGRFKLLSASPSGTGSLTLASPDLSPLLQSLALAFPDLLGRIPARATSTVALGGAGIGLTDLKGQVAGMALTGTLRLARQGPVPQATDAPVLTGELDIDRASAATLFGLALGPEQPAAPGSAWSNLAFAAGLVDPPRAAVRLNAKTLDVAAGLTATDATFDLGVAPNLVTMKDFAATFGGGRLSGNASLRRDGRQAGLEGTVAANGVRIALPGVTGTASGRLDLAGSGSSALSLVSSLAGSGEATLDDLVIPGADPAALPKIFAEVEKDDIAVDAETVARAFEDAAREPLDAGTQRFDLGLAGGILAFSPKPATQPGIDPVSSTVDGALDLRAPSLTTRAVETLDALPKGWTGAKPSLVVAWQGPPRMPRRSVDVSAFINAVAARALARETARIEAYEFDIRERAFFNARLQSERRRAQDAAKAEADARAAEAARIARARKEATARAARAEQERAAREKAADDQAAAEQERAAAERSDQNRAKAPSPPAGRREGPEPPMPAPDAPRFAPAPPGASNDPSAAGRY